jgi:hypothetical protein
MRYLILAQSECTAAALGAWLELLGEKVPSDADPNRLVIEPHHREKEGGLTVYHRAVEQIEAVIDRHPCSLNGDIVGLIDTVNPSRLCAISEGMDWDHLVALLILSFPEIKWVFGVVTGETADFPLENHNLLSLLTNARRDPLLDPTGLRDWVRSKSNQELDVPMRLPRRRAENLAAAIDDEVDYATMHGYTAYRYGYRADIITSWALMDERFGEGRAKHQDFHGYRLIMEDMRLTFADKPGRTSLSRLRSIVDKEGRDKYCPLLHWEKDDSEWRLLITSGQMGLDGELVEDNEFYLNSKKTGTGAICHKPLGGLCDIWTRTGMRNSGEHELNPRGNARGFVWPPEEFIDDLHDGHGAPGKIGMVARVLIERAGIAKNTASSACDWIRAAVLAGDAAELLSGKTPTLSLTAVALKHECEVRAECTFIGAGFRFGLRQRFKEIEAEVRSVCRWFQKKPRQARLDANATIINRIKLALGDVGQMEEEEQCLVKLRWLNRRMSVPKGWQHFTGVHWFAWLVLAYGEFLLGSFARLITLTALWVGGIGWAAMSLARESIPQGITAADQVPSRIEADVIGWFFGGNASSVHYEISVLAVTAGVFHLGILMSYLYSLISRK